MQILIAAELRNSQERIAEFERTYAVNPNAKVSSLVDRVLRRPKADTRYPQLSTATDRSGWLMPLLRRLTWHLAKDEAGAPWKSELQEMIGLALLKLARVSETEYLALGAVREAFASHHRQLYFACMAEFTRQLEKDGPLTRNVVDVLRQLLNMCDPPSNDTSSRKMLVWPFFRSETAFEDPVACWSSRIHRDLFRMPPDLRADWLSAFDAKSDFNCGTAGAPTRSCLAALKRLGDAQIEDGLGRWTSMLRDEPGPILTPAGEIVFQHVIVLCDLLGGEIGDQFLYNIARSPWTQRPAHGILKTFLWALSRRSPDRAFACLEAMMMNPAAAVDDVRRQYEALLTVFGASAVAQSPRGVDGYPLATEPALLPQQTRLDQYLHMAANAAAAGPYVDPRVTAWLAVHRTANKEEVTPAVKAAMDMWEKQLTRPLSWFPVAPEVTDAQQAMEAAILREFAGDPASLHCAVVARKEWIAGHRNDYSKDALGLWESWLQGLVRRTLPKIDEMSLESLLGALTAGGGSTKLIQLSQSYVAKNGWHPDLVKALREWAQTLYGSTSDQADRMKVEWLLWFEDAVPIDPAACWSHRIKQDLRAMPPQERAHWIALLDNHTFVVTGKPPVKWLKAAAVVFPPLGVAAFRGRFTSWFEPFENGEPLRLTTTGRHILRSLMWYALLAKDADVDAALLAFANAKWKTKEVAKRAAQAEMAFSYVVGQRAPETALPLLEKLVATGQAFDGSESHRIYQQLCARYGRNAVPAIPEKTGPQKTAGPHPLLDSMTISQFRTIMQNRLSR